MTDPVAVTLEKDACKTYEEAMLEIYRKLRPGEPPTVESCETPSTTSSSTRAAMTCPCRPLQVQQEAPARPHAGFESQASSALPTRDGRDPLRRRPHRHRRGAREMDAIGVNDVTIEVDGRTMRVFSQPHGRS